MRQVVALITLAVFLSQMQVTVPARAAEQATTEHGPALALGNGTVRGYVTVSTGTDGSRTPSAVGIEFSGRPFDALPAAGTDRKWCFTLEGTEHCLFGHELAVQLPAAASSTPFKWVQLNWNPFGHIPPGVYDLPHFDIHFHMRDQSRQLEVAMGLCPGALEPVSCESLERGRVPLPTQVAPPGYVDVGAVVAAMGNHLINPGTPEFGGKPFTHTFIYGVYDGDLTFFEPMITRAFFLTRPDLCSNIPQPKAFGTDAWYPTKYCVRYAAATDSYAVSLEGFVLRQDRSRLVGDLYQQELCREPDPEGLRTWTSPEVSFAQARAGVALSGEGRRAAGIRGLYLALLGRDPVKDDCTGFRPWVDSDWSLEATGELIMASQEYRAKLSTPAF